MCTYCGTTNYRKIYENHIGIIPKDNKGRSYDIHHIDGDHSNNDPENLAAVTIQEHYDIHYAQGDYGACYFIAIQRLNSTPEEIAAIAKKVADQRVLDNTHPWLDSTLASERNKSYVDSGTHWFIGGDIVRKQLENKTHANFIKITCLACKRVTNKTHFNKWHGANCKSLRQE